MRVVTVVIVAVGTLVAMRAWAQVQQMGANDVMDERARVMCAFIKPNVNQKLLASFNIVAYRQSDFDSGTHWVLKIKAEGVDGDVAFWRAGVFENNVTSALSLTELGAISESEDP